MPNAKLGAKVDRYSFFVRLLPPLLHTGLARRTSIAISPVIQILVEHRSCWPERACPTDFTSLCTQPLKVDI
jgi:hypothetical protein